MSYPPTSIAVSPDSRHATSGFELDSSGDSLTVVQRGEFRCALLKHSCVRDRISPVIDSVQWPTGHRR
jgi:hypothetical protein